MEYKPNREERRKQQKNALTKGFGRRDKFAGTHKVKRHKKENSN